MEKPRVFVHAETPHKVPLVTEDTGLLEEPPYECLPPSEHQCDDPFATCSVTVTYSYEGFPPTATRYRSPVVET